MYLAFNNFRYFLEGQRLHVTDNNALTCALTSGRYTYAPRKTRQMACIGEFMHDIRFIHGKDSALLDDLL